MRLDILEETLHAMVEYAFVHGVLWITAGAVFARLLYSAVLYPLMYTSITSELLVGMFVSAFAYERVMSDAEISSTFVALAAASYALVAVALQRILFPTSLAPHFWVSFVAFAGAAAVGQAAVQAAKVWQRRSHSEENGGR